LYGVIPYFIGKSLVELPLTMFLPVLGISISYYIIGLNPEFESFM